jgi:hypothetical protein
VNELSHRKTTMSVNRVTRLTCVLAFVRSRR